MWKRSPSASCFGWLCFLLWQAGVRVWADCPMEDRHWPQTVSFQARSAGSCSGCSRPWTAKRAASRQPSSVLFSPSLWWEKNTACRVNGLRCDWGEGGGVWSLSFGHVVHFSLFNRVIIMSHLNGFVRCAAHLLCEMSSEPLANILGQSNFIEDLQLQSWPKSPLNWSIWVQYRQWLYFLDAHYLG